MNIAICDDDVSFCILLDKLIHEYFKKNKLSSCNTSIFHSGEELLASDEVFDIAFLDVEMSGISGIHTGRQLKEKNKRLIFIIITSYSDYLDEALHFQAFRYLSKPLDKERLFRNLKDALHAYITNNKMINIETKTDAYTISTSDIIMVEASCRKVYVHTVSDKYISVHNMSYWDEHLNSPNFFRSHNSYIINMAYVREYNKASIYLYEDHREAYMTMRKYADFKRAYTLYLAGQT